MELTEAEQARLLLLTKPHFELTNDEKVSLTPLWQRQLLLPAESAQPNSLELIQACLPMHMPAYAHAYLCTCMPTYAHIDLCTCLPRLR